MCTVTVKRKRLTAENGWRAVVEVQARGRIRQQFFVERLCTGDCHCSQLCSRCALCCVLRMRQGKVCSRRQIIETHAHSPKDGVMRTGSRVRAKLKAGKLKRHFLVERSRYRWVFVTRQSINNARLAIQKLKQAICKTSCARRPCFVAPE